MSLRKIETLAGKCISSGLTGYVVQVESCTDRPSAEKLKERLSNHGYDAEIKVRPNQKRGTSLRRQTPPRGISRGIRFHKTPPA